MRTATEIQQIALYENPDHTVHLDVRVDGDTVWLTQQQMATLFGRGVPTISKHIHSALISSELKTSMMHPYTIDVDTIRCGPRGDPTFRWRPWGCPRFLTCPARAAASRDRRMT